MAGAMSALVLIPRFTSLVGVGEFTTVPVDVAGYNSAQIELWRGRFAMSGSGAVASFLAFLEESLDGVTWQPVAAVARGHDPGEGNSLVLNHIFSLRWFRVRVTLATTDVAKQPLVTCWVEGMLR
jgi:hypothetical protein